MTAQKIKSILKPGSPCDVCAICTFYGLEHASGWIDHPLLHFFEVCCSITGAENYPKSFFEEMFSASFLEENFIMMFGRLSKHSTKYKYYSSLDLIKKVNSWCESHYLDSIRFSDMRETLKNRIGVLNCYKKTHFNLSNVINEDCPEYEILRDYKLYCKKEGKEMPLCFDGTNHHMNKYFKQLQKALSSALNKLDSFWGFDGVVGYGLDYGFSHIEMDLKNRN